MKVTVCDICGKPAVILVGKSLWILEDKGGRITQGRPLDLCQECLATLTALAEKGR